jgi:hypothetical protein
LVLFKSDILILIKNFEIWQSGHFFVSRSTWVATKKTYYSLPLVGIWPWYEKNNTYIRPIRPFQKEFASYLSDSLKFIQSKLLSSFSLSICLSNLRRSLNLSTESFNNKKYEWMTLNVSWSSIFPTMAVVKPR